MPAMPALSAKHSPGSGPNPANHAGWGWVPCTCSGATSFCATPHPVLQEDYVKAPMQTCTGGSTRPKTPALVQSTVADLWELSTPHTRVKVLVQNPTIPTRRILTASCNRATGYPLSPLSLPRRYHHALTGMQPGQL